MATIYPDLLVFKGNIITVDKDFSITEAVATKEEFVGSIPGLLTKQSNKYYRR
jgi:hypothetical protein